MRAGLDAAGWQCVLAVDNDPDTIAVHRLAHGSAVQADVTKLKAEDLPRADAWVAGFPCQPFSSSGNRAGFGHRSGNVFEHLVRLMKTERPLLAIFENVEGLLTNKFGHTWTVILSQLTGLGYHLSWLLVNLRWFGPPQTRERLFLLAAQPQVLSWPQLREVNGLLPGIVKPEFNAFAHLLSSKGVLWAKRFEGDLSAVEKELHPAIGKPKPSGQFLFGPLGHSVGSSFFSFDISAPKFTQTTPPLGAVVAPNFQKPALIGSARYWTTDSGRGPTRLWLRPEPVSHCIGTSLGGAPLYAVPLGSVKRASDRGAFLEFSNWHREQDGVLVMRLRPDRAVLLFGPHTEALHRALIEWDAGDTRKYKIVGNMVAPVCAKSIAELVNGQLSKRFRPISREGTAHVLAAQGMPSGIP